MVTGTELLHPVGSYDGTLTDYGLVKYDGVGFRAFFAAMVSTQHGTVKGLFSFNDKAAAATIGQIRYLGFQGDDLAALNTDRSLIGRRCRVDVQHQNWGGEMRAVIVSIDPAAPSLRRDPAAAEYVKKYNHLLREHPPIRPAAAPQAAPAVPPRNPAEQPPAHKEFAVKPPPPPLTSVAQSSTRGRDTTLRRVEASWLEAQKKEEKKDVR